MGRQVCRVLLSLSYVSLQKRQYDSKRSTSCPDLIPLCTSLCGKRGENKGADSNGAKKNEFSWINLWSILWVLKFLRCWNIFAELINGSRLGVVIIKQCRWPHFLLTHSPAQHGFILPGLSHWTLVTQKAPCMSEGNVVWTYICYCRWDYNISLREDFSFESIWDMRGKKRVSNISEFQSGVDLRMKRPGFRVPGSVVRITLQDFMTYRHEHWALRGRILEKL